MRFLHTSDWHVGKTLRGRSRIDEHEAIRCEIVEIAVREKVDCLLVSGDIFDSYAPSPEAERLVYNFFAELLARKIPAVIIGGNHDHPRRLAAIRQLLDHLGIYMRPEPAAPSAGGIIDFRNGDELAKIAVLPFVPERKIVDVCQMMAPEENWYAEYSDRVARMLEKLSEAFSTKTVNILVAHLYVHGSQTSGSEREIHVAQPYAISAQRLPATAHYVALGHLHRPQNISAPSPCNYAGSPLQLDFGEQGQQKEVVLIEAHPGIPARVQRICLKAGRKLRDVTGTLEQIEADAPSYGDDYLRITVNTSGPVPGIADRVRQSLPNALDVRLDYPRAQTVSSSMRRQMPPEQLFKEFYQVQHGAPASDTLLTAFRELYDEVTVATD
jgi:exonuclease SbcD